MKVIRVNLKERSYQIIVGNNLLRQAGTLIQSLNLGCSAYIITNARIKSKYAGTLLNTLKAAGLEFKFKLVADSEESKSLKTAYSIIKDITAFDKNRRLFIVAFGGGVIGDLAGFLASIYKRGVFYIQIPTTLLAQVDSSIGGKTAVDLADGKNLVGAFYQPRLVLSDIDLLRTLDLRQLRSGLAEVIKYGIIKDKELFNCLENKYRDIFALRQGVTEFMVSRCSAIKARIVEQDERDTKGIRAILNFGHTLGHAIEAASGYKGHNHGEAVALGMLLATDISRRLGLIKSGVSQRIESLIQNAGLPTRIIRTSLNKIITAHYRDKKFIGARNRFVLLEDIGKTKIVENIPLRIITEALKERS